MLDERVYTYIYIYKASNETEKRKQEDKNATPWSTGRRDMIS